jgi:hypothetical protein
MTHIPTTINCTNLPADRSIGMENFADDDHAPGDLSELDDSVQILAHCQDALPPYYFENRLFSEHLSIEHLAGFSEGTSSSNEQSDLISTLSQQLGDDVTPKKNLNAM